MRSNFLCLSVTSFPRTKFQSAWVLSTNRQDSFPPKYKAHSRTYTYTVQLIVCVMIEQLQYVAKEYGEKRAKEAMKKSSRSKQFQNSTQKRALYQGILHQNILETRLMTPMWVQTLSIRNYLEISTLLKKCVPIHNYAFCHRNYVSSVNYGYLSSTGTFC